MTASARTATLPGARRIALRWTLVAALIAAIMLMPVLVALASLTAPTGDVWGHLGGYVLPRVLRNTLLMVVAVGLATSVIGTAAAWLTAVCEFPGRRFFSWALLLPLALPGFVIAFALSGVFTYTAPLQTALRALAGDGFALPSPGAGGAAAICLTLTLYPYVYLLARQAFVTQGARGLEVAQSLGMNRREGFRRVSVPMARPWIASGAALAMMEALADFGTVKVFNFDTFTTAIYSAWYGLQSLDAALQMSVVLMMFVFVALLLERRSRGRAQFLAASGRARPARIRLSRRGGWAAFAACGALFTIAFALPVLQLLLWGAGSVTSELSADYLGYMRSSLALAAGGALLVPAIAVLLAYSVRLSGHPAAAVAARLATLGYAIPGTVLAVGFYAAVAGLGHGLTWAWRGLTSGDAAPVVLTGTLSALLLAYCARFLAVAYGPVESAMQRITPRIDDASRGLGVTGWRLLAKVHVPVVSGGVATAALLAFVDIMKELPITLMTRPFGWDTLAVRVFQMTTEGEWRRAAIPALAIVIAGLLPVAWLHRRSLGDGRVRA